MKVKSEDVITVLNVEKRSFVNEKSGKTIEYTEARLFDGEAIIVCSVGNDVLDEDMKGAKGYPSFEVALNEKGKVAKIKLVEFDTVA